MSPFLVLPRTLAKPLRWPTESVTRARRNARLASAALAVRKAEREDVARFLAEHDAPSRARVDLAVEAPVDIAVPLPRQHRVSAEQRR